MARLSAVARLENAVLSSAWSVVAGVLVVEGIDAEAEDVAAAFGAGSQLRMNLIREVEAGVKAIPLVEEADLLPAMRESAVQLDRFEDRRWSRLPDDLKPLTLWLLCTSNTSDLAREVGGHPMTPPAALGRIARRWMPDRGSSIRADDDYRRPVLATVAANRSASAEVLALLSRHPLESVRVAVAANPATPFPELRRMVQGPAGPVRSAAASTVALLEAQHSG